MAKCLLKTLAYENLDVVATIAVEVGLDQGIEAQDLVSEFDRGLARVKGGRARYGVLPSRRVGGHDDPSGAVGDNYGERRLGGLEFGTGNLRHAGSA